MADLTPKQQEALNTVNAANGEPVMIAARSGSALERMGKIEKVEVPAGQTGKPGYGHYRSK